MAHVSTSKLQSMCILPNYSPYVHFQIIVLFFLAHFQTIVLFPISYLWFFCPFSNNCSLCIFLLWFFCLFPKYCSFARPFPNYGIFPPISVYYSFDHFRHMVNFHLSILLMILFPFSDLLFFFPFLNYSPQTCPPPNTCFYSSVSLLLNYSEEISTSNDIKNLSQNMINPLKFYLRLRDGGV